MVYLACSWLGVKDKSIEGLYQAVVATPSADFWHVDVMEKGKLVQNDSPFRDPRLILDVRKRIEEDLSKNPGRAILNGQLVMTHLMVDDPAAVVGEFIPCSDYISFHRESLSGEDRIAEARAIIASIRKGTTYRGLSPRPGIAISPGTGLDEIADLLPDVDYVLVMSVVPGAAGRDILLDESLDKISALVHVRQEARLNFQIAVDGGVTVSNSSLLLEKGADILVSGTGVFHEDHDESVQRMKTVGKGEAVLIAADHGAMTVKKDIAEVLREMGRSYIDMGPPPMDSVDFPLYAGKVARLLSSGKYKKGIVSCTSGQGMIETVSRFPGVRAGLLLNPYHARMTVEHNDINCLVIPQMKDKGVPLMKNEVREILSAHFSAVPPREKKYLERIRMMDLVAGRY